MTVPVWAIAILAGLLGTLLGLAVKWGAQQVTITRLERDVTDLSTAVRQLAERVNALTVAIAEDHAAAHARDTGAFAEITALTGTGNSTYGISLNNNARARISDPSTGTTITGTTADVLLGGAGAKALTAINTGNAADTNDYASTTPENVSCSK